MQADGDELLDEQGKQQLVQAIEALIEVRNGDNADAIELEIKNIDKASQDFASRRMDKSIRAALSGQSVDNI
jgi:molecular chaperone HscA